jgi:hypothetical protein
LTYALPCSSLQGSPPKLLTIAWHLFSREKIEAIIKETSLELQLSQSLGGASVYLAEQDSSTLVRTVMKVAGIALSIAGAVLSLLAAPLAPLVSIGAAIIRIVSSLFQTKAAKRAKAAQSIERSLRSQIDSYHKKLESQMLTSLHGSAGKIERGYSEYFSSLAKTMTNVSSFMSQTVAAIREASRDSSHLFAKRVLDWAEERPEVLSRLVVEQRIRSVDRHFGISMRIIVHGRLRLKMNLDKLSKTIQEQVSLESVQEERGKFLGTLGSRQVASRR